MLIVFCGHLDGETDARKLKIKKRKKMKRLETLYQNLRDGKIDEDRACNIIIDAIYKNKVWFGLASLEQDDLHDFLLYYMGKVSAAIKSYRPDQAALSSYLYVSVNNALSSWKKKQKQMFLEEKSFDLVQEVYFEENSGLYGVRDGHVVCQKSDEEIRHSVKEVENFKRLYRPVSYSGKKNYRRSQAFFSKKMDSLRKEAILILVLKCCYSVGPDEVEKASVLLGMDVNELSGLIEKAKQVMAGKKKLFDDIKAARDNAFFYKRKYSLISASCGIGTYDGDIIKEKEEKKAKKWRAKNMKLKGFRSMVPSNITVSKILGMSDRHVKYILKSAEKFIDNISLKRYYDWHENLFGKRKFEQEAGNE